VITNFYSGLKLTARASFIGYALLACSSTPAPTTVPLESVVVQSDACKRIANRPLSPVVYECQTSGNKIFATTLKDCSIPEKLTFQTTTRQLLVGMVGLKVISQEPVQFGATKTLQTVVTGTLDAEPVMMSTFTFRNSSCVTDIILWQGSSSSQTSTEKLADFTRSSSELTGILLR